MKNSIEIGIADLTETLDILTAEVICNKKQMSGKCSDVSSECDNCGLNYMMGTWGENIRAKELAVGILRNLKDIMSVKIDS